MPKKGYKQTDEHRKKLSDIKIGKVPWNKGTKGVMKAWNKGTKGLMPTSWIKGKHHKPESIQKMSLKAKGRVGYWTDKKRDKETTVKMWKSRPRYFGLEKIMRKRESNRKYREKYPERKLNYDRNYLTKLGLEFKLPRTEYFLALNSWSKTIRAQHNNTCQICHSPAQISHHIIHKSKYPALSLNIHNGIALCRSCHNEVHGWKTTKMNKTAITA